MKFRLPFLLSTFLAALTFTSVQAQQQPVSSVSITAIDVTTGGIAGIEVTNGGTGYTSAPTVVFSGGGGTGAIGVANVVGGSVVSVDITSTGTGYKGVPAITFSGGGGTGATGRAFLESIPAADPNEAYGVYGRTVYISALAVGTFPAAGYTYEFFINGVSIGVPTNPPNGTAVTVAWTPPQPGSYFISVKATGSSGTDTSLPVRYFASGTVVNSPVNNTIVPVGSSIVLKADATVEGGFIQQIQFYDNGVAIGLPDSTIPYSMIYTPPGGAGSPHAITARATDNNGTLQPASAAVAISVVNPISPPPVSVISTPANGAGIAIPDYVADPAAKITIAVDAHSSSGVINKVELYIDGVLFSTKTAYPYTFNWQPRVTGSFNLVALTYDDRNNVVASTTSATASATPAPTTVRIAEPPTVTMSSPVNGATITGGSPISISANVTSSSGSAITSVQFFDSGVYLGQATVPTSGNTYTITFTPAPKFDANGNPVPTVLTALATDEFGISKVSSGISLNVTTGGNPPPPPVIGIAPVVSVTSPLPSTQLTVNSPIRLTASATDADGNVLSVDFIVNDVKVASDATYPYDATWTPTSLGTYQITAKATDNSTNSVTSTPITVTVVDPSAAAPVVTIIDPLSGATLPVGSVTNVTATASDDVAIRGVQFYVNGQVFGALDTTFPFSVPFVPTSAGSFTIVAVATDNVGNQTASSPVTVLVSGGNAPAVAITHPVAGTSVALGNGVPISVSATDSDGSIARVDVFANGVLIPGGSLSSPPFNLSWIPGGAGNYSLTAVATDNTGNTKTSAPVTVSVTSGSAPGVVITAPASGSVYGVGVPVTFSVNATAVSGALISRVQFLVNGIAIAGSPRTTAPYTLTWTPAAVGTYELRAVATDSAGATTTTAATLVTIGSNTPPTVTLTSPSANLSLSAGNVINLAASAADLDGLVTSVRFLANGIVVGTVTSAPYISAWTPTAPGNYSLVAQASDSAGNVTNSASVVVAVTPNATPTVALTSPRTGVTISVASPVTLTASASDPDGTIAGVQFFANGVALGSDLVAPYSTSFTPNAEGLYRLTVVAVDNSGTVVTSPAVLVQAAVASSGTLDTIASGIYISLTGGSGNLTAINLHGRSATFIGYVPASPAISPAKTYYFADVPVDVSGGFEHTTSSGTISGSFSDSGVSGTFTDGAASVSFSGPNTFATSNAVVSAGFYSGSLTSRFGSVLTGIIGLDGKLTLYAKDGAFVDSGQGAVSSNGAFSFTTRAGSKFAGTADPTTGLLTGTLTKAAGGSETFTGAQSSGSSFSDGSLRNISSRGFVGTGNDVLIAGFVVNGTTPKQILIRAIGPTLTGLGVPGALTNPALYLFNQSGTQIGTNDNWSSGGVAISTAASQVGAFALGAGSLDAAILTTLAPGVYSTQVSGVSGAKGIALLELYDVDAVAAFSPEKMVNISTRSQVGTGDNILIAGFVVNGTSPKKVLIRGVGPQLSVRFPDFFTPGAVLADPVLRIVRPNGTLVRENDDWGTGNDVTLVMDAAARIGAFPLTEGSKDAAILMNLPPGVYSAQLSGASNGTGIGLIEVYEVQ